MIMIEFVLRSLERKKNTVFDFYKTDRKKEKEQTNPYFGSYFVFAIRKNK